MARLVRSHSDGDRSWLAGHLGRAPEAGLCRRQPAGYYGLSQGGGVGMHLVAAEPRITAAVLGLDESDVLISIAPRITIPVEFGSAEKTLHANPGSHFEVPDFEIDSSIRFFARHLGSQGAAI